jgi:hypothetical protein
MFRNILWIVAVVALCIGGYYLYKQYTGRDPLGSGSVVTRTSADGSSNTDIDGNADDQATTTFNKNAPAPGRASNQPPAADKASIASGSGTVGTGPTPTPQDGGGMIAVTPQAPAGAPTAMPVADSQAGNNPNDMHFGGSGRFQWYRQGNLTWRVDTQSGSTCIAFATNEEWRKSLVMSHGCGNA